MSGAATDATADSPRDPITRRAATWLACCAAAGLGLGILTLPPGRILDLVRTADPWTVYDEYVIPEAAAATWLGLDPPTVLGTPAGPPTLIAFLLLPLVAPAGAEGPPVPADVPTARIIARVQAFTRASLLDPRSIGLALRVISLVAAVVAGACVARACHAVAWGTAGTPCLLLGLVVVVLPPVSYLASTGLSESLGLALLSSSLLFGLAGAGRVLSNEPGGRAGTAWCWAGSGLLAGLAAATKGNFGVAATVGTVAWLAWEGMPRRSAAPGRKSLARASLIAFSACVALGFFAGCPSLLGRPLLFAKAQVFTLVVFGRAAGEGRSLADALVGAFGLPLLVLAPIAVAVALTRGPRARLVAFQVLGYLPVLAAMRFAKPPWAAPILPGLLACIAILMSGVIGASRLQPAALRRVLGWGLLAVLAVEAAVRSHGLLDAAASEASCGRALRSWAREHLPGAGPTLVIGRHLELPPTAAAARASLEALRSAVRRREEALPPGVAATLLVEERFEMARLELLSHEAPTDPPRFDVRVPAVAGPEIPSTLDASPCVRVIAPAGVVASWGGVPSGWVEERRFERSPHAPIAVSFDVVVLAREPRGPR